METGITVNSVEVMPLVAICTCMLMEDMVVAVAADITIMEEEEDMVEDAITTVVVEEDKIGGTETPHPLLQVILTSQASCVLSKASMHCWPNLTSNMCK